MNAINTSIDGLVIVEPDFFGDSRGWFCEQYNEGRYSEVGISARFVQDNESLSNRGVIRGLHWQEGQHCQAKLVRVIRGAVWDVAVDIRAGSPTFGKHVGVYLCSRDSAYAKEHGDIATGQQFYIPRGFAHGFICLEDNTLFSYKCDNLYCKEAERGVLFSDPAIGIQWPDAGVDRIVSDKDMLHPTLSDIEPYDWGLV